MFYLGDLFSYDLVYRGKKHSIDFVNVTLTRDFGPLSKDQRFLKIVLDALSLKMEFYETEEEPPFSVSFKLTPEWGST